MIRIAFLDCDGTLTKVKSSWQYLHERLGLWDDNADAFQRLYREGKIDYHEFCRRDALLWQGMPVSRVMEIIDEIPYQDGARELADFLRNQGIESIILSTGLSLLVDKVRQELNITAGLSNDLIAREGCLTGEIRINVEHDNKGPWVERLLESRGIGKEEAVAIGDGEGDRGMFEAVGLALGFHPQPALLPLLDGVLLNGTLLPVIEIIKKRR